MKVKEHIKKVLIIFGIVIVMSLVLFILWESGLLIPLGIIGLIVCAILK